MREYTKAVKAATKPVTGKQLRSRLKVSNINLVVSLFAVLNLALKWLSVAQRMKLFTSSGDRRQQLIEQQLVPKATHVLTFMRNVVSPDDDKLAAAQQLKICVVLKKHNATADDLRKIAKV
jgi:hypothetical protein